MRNYLYTLIGIILFSCGGSDDDPTPKPPVNVAPSIPVLVFPNDGELCTENPLDFNWEASLDGEGDSISYEIEVATNSSFNENLQKKTTSMTTISISLIKGVAYYWRVRSKDTKNNYSNHSNTRKYYTEGEGVSNHIPFTATLISPVLGSEINSSTGTLEWTSSDVDNDPLVYDVYFGKANPPVLVVENLSELSYDVNLDISSMYYWKIVVRDDKGGQSIGQIWDFSTE